MTFPRSAIDGPRIVVALTPAADAAGRNGRWVSLKGFAKAGVIALVGQGNAATVALTIEQAKDVSGTGAKPLANAVPIAANQDAVAGDALVRQTAGVSFTTSAAVKDKVVVFDIDPALLDVNNGFDCIRVSTGASNAANVTSAVYQLMGQRYTGAASPSAVTN